MIWHRTTVEHVKEHSDCTEGNTYYRIDVPAEAKTGILEGLSCALCNIKFGMKTGEAKPMLKKPVSACLGLKDLNAECEYVLCNTFFYSKGIQDTQMKQQAISEPRARTRGWGYKNN